MTSEARLQAAGIAAWLTLSCTGEPPSNAHQFHADREAYVASLARPSDPNACAPIVDPSMGAECLAMVAGHFALDGRVEAASALCSGLKEGLWRDECAFLVAEKADVPSAQQRQLCDASGSLAQQCRGHLLRRASLHLLEGLAVGHEPAAYEAVLALSAEFFPRGGEARARRLVVEHLAARAPQAPFGRTHCGAASRDLCVNAYAERVQMAARLHNDQTRDLASLDALPWQPVCDSLPTLARVEALGLPTWDPEMNGVAQEAWSLLCGAQPAHSVRR